MTKQARIVVTNYRGRHSSGYAEEAQMELRAGRKGKGQLIYSVLYWPWSPPSEDAAVNAMYEVADKAGYEIIPAHVS